MVTIFPAGRLVLFAVTGAVDFCDLLPEPKTLLTPALGWDDVVEDELRAVERSEATGWACGRGRAAPVANPGSTTAVGDLIRDGDWPALCRGVGVVRGATGQPGTGDCGGAGVCGGATGGATVPGFSSRTGTGALATSCPLTIAIATSA